MSVQIGKQWINWMPNTAKTLDTQSIWIQNSPTLVVKSKERTFVYKLFSIGTAIPDDYLGCIRGENGSAGYSSMCFQLEEDLSLYLVSDSNLFPKSLDILQPSGFPIRPD